MCARDIYAFSVLYPSERGGVLLAISRLKAQIQNYEAGPLGERSCVRVCVQGRVREKEQHRVNPAGEMNVTTKEYKGYCNLEEKRKEGTKTRGFNLIFLIQRNSLGYFFLQAKLPLDVEDLLYTRTVRMEAKARKSHSPAHFGQREKGAYLHN